MHTADVDDEMADPVVRRSVATAQGRPAVASRDSSSARPRLLPTIRMIRLTFVDSDRVRRPVVELRRLRERVPGDLLRVFERSPVRQIRRDPRRPKRVAGGGDNHWILPKTLALTLRIG